MNKQIKVKDLSVSYQKSGKYHKIIDNIDFYIEPSEIFAIIGESGSGKTTITKALTGLLPKSTKISGLMQIGESNYDLSNDYERKKLSGTEIGLVFQDARSSLNPMRKIIKHFEEIYVNIKGLSKEECYTKSAEILKYLGFNNYERILNCYPFELSGGMCQRIVIALVITMSPSILIADEITSALDIINIKESLKFIKDISKEFGIAVLFITHDMKVVKTYADRIMILKDHKLKDIKKSEIPEILNENESKSENQNKKEILKVNNLNKSYDNFKVLKDVDFSLYQQESLGVLGKSGCGKSTLAKILACIEDYDKGNIIFDSEELQKLYKRKKYNIYRDIQLVFQDERGCLNPSMKVRDLVMEPIRHLKLNYKDKELEVEKYLKLVGLDHEHYDKKASMLSTGQCQRVSLARALIVKPKLLILDEMVSALDSILKWKIVNLLRDIVKSRNISLIVISHEIDVVSALCDRILYMKNGKITSTIESGDITIENMKELYFREEKYENY